MVGIAVLTRVLQRQQSLQKSVREVLDSLGIVLRRIISRRSHNMDARQEVGKDFQIRNKKMLSYQHGIPCHGNSESHASGADHQMEIRRGNEKEVLKTYQHLF